MTAPRYSVRRDIQSIPPQPTPRWLLARLARLVAFGFGSGLLRPAPGTWGTLAAWLIWAVAVPADASPLGTGLFLLVAFLYGCWCCGTVGRELGVPDYGGLVWDEFVSFWLVLWVLGLFWGIHTVAAQAVAFILFRVFDIIKPAPVRNFERHYKSGFGVMGDDVLAAAYTLLALWGLIWLAPGLLGA